MAEPTLPEICQALRIEPGQTLVIRVNPDRFLTRQQFAEFADHLKAGAPPDIKLLLVAADEIAVVEAAGAAAPFTS